MLLMQRANILWKKAPAAATAVAVLWVAQRRELAAGGGGIVSVLLPAVSYFGVTNALLLQQKHSSSYSRYRFLSADFYSKRSTTTSTLCEARPMSSERVTTTSSTTSEKRERKTAADAYFQKHKELPRPAVMHVVLSPSSDSDDTNNDDRQQRRPYGILVIGDVHGCYDEMLLLYEKAVQANYQQRPFRYVILVGDLCNKGPKSVQVIRHVRNNRNNNWLSVRGNHDNGALKAALASDDDNKRKKYDWIEKQGLSDEDVAWMSELPYTIRIPADMLTNDDDEKNDAVDTIIVHAGLVPGVALDDQTIETMITIREVVQSGDDNSNSYQYYRGGGGGGGGGNNDDGSNNPQHCAWASAWQGPERVIFGHDARRGLQIDNNKAIGLDTGAVYGKKLTAILLPSRRIISVDALETHSPIIHKGSSKD